MMLAGYYYKNADFKSLFDKLAISKDESYLEHLHKHKVNSSPDEALQQIKEKKYAQALAGYSGEKLVIGLSWHKKAKAHKILIKDIA